MSLNNVLDMLSNRLYSLHVKSELLGEPSERDVLSFAEQGVISDWHLSKVRFLKLVE